MIDQKVTPDHLRRPAFLYIRQSTMKQVFEHRESTERQYDLKTRAFALGWKKDQIVIIDDDLGLSGTSTHGRGGFQHLVAEVGLGRVGLVMGLEVSRLARNNADWQRLLEISAMTDTLILDEDGLYDPSDFNDRLLLGLKGTMSEAEIHFLRARMEGGKLNKAKRGELKLPLTIGYVHDDSGKIVFDPDRQVREAISHLFATYQRCGSAYAVVKHFRENGLKFPAHIQGGPNAGEVLWNSLTRTRVLHVLHNPIYAGAYVFSRTRTRKNPITGKNRIQTLPKEQWKVFLPNAHEGYISWEQYQRNQNQLGSNACAHGEDRRCGPPRSGPALLQGIVLCGRCGQRMTVRYHSRRGTLIPTYRCQRGGETSSPICQSVPGLQVEEAISRLLLDMVSPLSFDLSQQVFDEIRTRRDEVVQLHWTRLECARHDAHLAQRRFFSVNPQNRLVADDLERRWNDALRAVVDLEAKYEQVLAEKTAELTAEEHLRIRKLVEDFPSAWNDPHAPSKERKRMIRLLIEDVTLLKTDKIHIKVQFKAGATEELCVPIRSGSKKTRQSCSELLARIRDLAHTKTDGEIASELNQAGYLSSAGLAFTSRIVYYLRRYYNIAGLYEHLRTRGYLTVDELATHLTVSKTTVHRWGKAGMLKTHRYNDKGQVLYENLNPTSLSNIATQNFPELSSLCDVAESAKGGAV
jgi:DNA invertase Pin-like site-specific DNA recombinase